MTSRGALYRELNATSIATVRHKIECLAFHTNVGMQAIIYLFLSEWQILFATQLLCGRTLAQQTQPLNELESGLSAKQKYHVARTCRQHCTF